MFTKPGDYQGQPIVGPHVLSPEDDAVFIAAEGNGREDDVAEPHEEQVHEHVGVVRIRGGDDVIEADG